MSFPDSIIDHMRAYGYEPCDPVSVPTGTAGSPYVEQTFRRRVPLGAEAWLRTSVDLHDSGALDVSILKGTGVRVHAYYYLAPHRDNHVIVTVLR